LADHRFDAAVPPECPAPGARPHSSAGRTLKLGIVALGVVYGDIGTSPLYAVRECFTGPHAIALNKANLLGVASLIFWSLTAVVTVKYVGFILRADHRGITTPSISVLSAVEGLEVATQAAKPFIVLAGPDSCHALGLAPDKLLPRPRDAVDRR
jgi:KUP system potassium uptake protein